MPKDTSVRLHKNKTNTKNIHAVHKFIVCPYIRIEVKSYADLNVDQRLGRRLITKRSQLIERVKIFINSTKNIV